jgi:hypothetical protein
LWYVLQLPIKLHPNDFIFNLVWDTCLISMSWNFKQPQSFENETKSNMWPQFFIVFFYAIHNVSSSQFKQDLTFQITINVHGDTWEHLQTLRNNWDIFFTIQHFLQHRKQICFGHEKPFIIAIFKNFLVVILPLGSQPRSQQDKRNELELIVGTWPPYGFVRSTWISLWKCKGGSPKCIQ